MKIQVVVFWVVTPCSDWYQHFGGPCCLLLQGEGPPKRWYLTISLHGVRTHETST